MTILLLCNIGNRDVKVQDKVLAESLGISLGREKEPPWTIWATRQGGQQLLAHYDDVIDDLMFSILEPCLAHVMNRHRKQINRLLLFGTDQPQGLVADFHRQKDTLYFADLMARYYQAQAELRIQTVEPRYVRGVDAALYDEAFDAYGRLLADLPQEIEVCYLIVTGGMPACNAALLLQGVRRWGGRARVLYLPQGRSEPRELRAGEQILASFQQAVVEAHLERLDFAAARPLMAATGAHRPLQGLVAYAQQRLDFDFDGAQETLLGECERHGDIESRRFLDTVRHDLDALVRDADSTTRLKTLLAELFWNSEIAFTQRRYADFLARVYRFQEAVLRYLVETAYGWPTDLSPKARKATLDVWNHAILHNSDLMTHLIEQEVNGWPLTERQINRYTFKVLLSYALDQERGLDEDGKPIICSKDLPFLEAQVKRINAFDKLVELRHRSVVGHDFEGISRAKILNAYARGEKDKLGQPDPVLGMKKLLAALHVEVYDNPYHRLAGFVAGRLLAEGQA